MNVSNNIWSPFCRGIIKQWWLFALQIVIFQSYYRFLHLSSQESCNWLIVRISPDCSLKLLGRIFYLNPKIGSVKATVFELFILLKT